MNIFHRKGTKCIYILKQYKYRDPGSEKSLRKRNKMVWDGKHLPKNNSIKQQKQKKSIFRQNETKQMVKNIRFGGKTPILFHSKTGNNFGLANDWKRFFIPDLKCHEYRIVLISISIRRNILIFPMKKCILWMKFIQSNEMSVNKK